MSGLKILVLSIVGAIAAFILWSVVVSHYSSEYYELATSLHEQLVELRRAHRIALEEETQQYHESILAEWGQRPIDRAKDPSLSIPDMLWAVTKAASPPESRVFVHVEDFSDIEVYVNLPGSLTLDESTTMLRDLLIVGGEFLSAVVLIENEGATAEVRQVRIEREDFSEVKDFRNLDSGYAKELLLRTAQFPRPQG